VVSEAGSRIAKNSVFNLLRTCLALPIMLLITPYVLRHLGKDEFGIWALVSVITSYAQLSDFGMTESLIRFAAEYKARDDSQALNRLVNTALTAYVVIGGATISLFYCALPLVIKNVLNIPAPLLDKAGQVFMIAVTVFFFSMMMGVFGSLIVGFQRMGQSNVIGLLSTILSAVGTFYFIQHGYGLLGLVYNNAIISFLTAGANLFIAWRLFPALRINPFGYFRIEMLKTIFTFSWKVQVSILSQLFVYQIDRILLSRYLGLSAVATYDVANRVATQARTFLASIFTPIIPAASSLYAQDDKDKIVGLYNRAFKYLSVTAIPFSVLIIALADPFVRTWLGPGYERTAVTLQLLMAAYLVNLFPGPGSFILSGMNRPQVTMKASVIAGLLNVIACLVCVRLIGYYGVIVGISMSLVVSALYFIRELHRAVPQIRWGLYRDVMLVPVLLAALLVVPLLGVQFWYDLSGYPVLILAASLYALGFCFVIYTRTSYFDDFDRTLINRFTGRV